MEKLLIVYNTHYYRSVDVHQPKQTPPRVVSNFELEFYTTDTNTSVINDRPYNQEVNNILIARPGDVRYSINNFECYSVQFSSENEQVQATLNKLPNVFRAHNHEHILSLFKSITTFFPCVLNEDELILQGKILELIGRLAKENTSAPLSQHGKYSVNISDACIYMAANFDKNLTLKDIARAANLSPSFFHSLFKQFKGRTPHEYLQQLRVSMSKNLLRNSSKSLAEISLLCGFDSQSYFSYIFKRETGVSPNSYRRNTQLFI